MGAATSLAFLLTPVCAQATDVTCMAAGNAEGTGKRAAFQQTVRGLAFGASRHHVPSWLLRAVLCRSQQPNERQAQSCANEQSVASGTGQRKRRLSQAERRHEGDISASSKRDKKVDQPEHCPGDVSNMAMSATPLQGLHRPRQPRTACTLIAAA